jgi:hypothetical protein
LSGKVLQTKKKTASPIRKKKVVGVKGLDLADKGTMTRASQGKTLETGEVLCIGGNTSRGNIPKGNTTRRTLSQQRTTRPPKTDENKENALTFRVSRSTMEKKPLEQKRPALKELSLNELGTTIEVSTTRVDNDDDPSPEDFGAGVGSPLLWSRPRVR